MKKFFIAAFLMMAAALEINARNEVLVNSPYYLTNEAAANKAFHDKLVAEIYDLKQQAADYLGENHQLVQRLQGYIDSDELLYAIGLCTDLDIDYPCLFD